MLATFRTFSPADDLRFDRSMLASEPSVAQRFATLRLARRGYGTDRKAGRRVGIARLEWRFAVSRCFPRIDLP